MLIYPTSDNTKKYEDENKNLLEAHNLSVKILPDFSPLSLSFLLCHLPETEGRRAAGQEQVPHPTVWDPSSTSLSCKTSKAGKFH